MTKAVMMFCLSSVVAFAGTVHFDPPSATITPGTPSVSFEVSVSWETMPTIDTVNVQIIGDLGADLAFEFAQSFVDSATIVPQSGETGFCCGAGGCGCEDVNFFGARFPPATGWTSPLLIGTLMVDTDGLLANIVTEFGVFPELEANLVGSAISLVASGANQEPVAGLATITVVPEPGIVGLMIVGMLLVAREDRDAGGIRNPVGVGNNGGDNTQGRPGCASPTLG